MRVTSLILDLGTSLLSLVAGALVSDWTLIDAYTGRVFPPLDISYVFGEFSSCEFSALLTLLDAKRPQIQTSKYITYHNTTALLGQIAWVGWLLMHNFSN